MLKIRLKRIGKKNTSQFRVVIMPARSKRDGKAIEYIGYYNPRSKELKLKLDRAKYWLSVGAKPTDTVLGILVKHKLAKAPIRPKKQPKEPKSKSKQEKKSEDKPAQKEPKKTSEKIVKQESKDKKPLKEKVVNKNEKPSKKEVEKKK